jgi:Zn-dependent peptidase ImmA (M78 family)/DNA-binding XRE family transcriptional regulator
MNGERIKLARKKAGLSLRDLADKMENLVSAQAIGKYERGEMSPGSEVLTALSKALGVTKYYLKSPQEIELGEVEFRTKSNTQAKDRARVETEVIEWVERYLQIEEILALDSALWTAPDKMPRRLSCLDDAEKLADELRNEWKLGGDPIPNMTELLEEKGIKVLLAELPDKVSGLTCLVKRPKHDDEIPVIVVNRNQTIERRRFNMAHELAHRLIKPESEGKLETLCHRFAGAFLAPRNHLQNEIGNRRSAFGYSELIDLKQLYRISASAFLMRLEQVGAINEWSKQYAFRSFAKDWRTNEPEPLEADKERGTMEAPRRFERLVYRAAAEDMISLAKASELLRLPLPAIEEGLKGPAKK